MDNGGLFEFSESSNERGPHQTVSRQPLKALSIEDDTSYQATISFALRSLQLYGRPIELLTAQSAAQGAKILAEEADIAVILLDVVMEEDDSGLRLVDWIRDAFGNDMVRIILLTGQPGMAPRRDVMSRYDINDYWCKSEISSEQLLSVVRSNLCTWKHLQQLQRARKGLSLVVEASRAINSKPELRPFCEEVADQIAHILDVRPIDILCLRYRQDGALDDGEVIAARGEFQSLAGMPVASLTEQRVLPTDLFERAMSREEQTYERGYTLRRFSTAEIDDSQYLFLIRTDDPLEQEQRDLLQVFCENIDTSFVNVALHHRLTELAYIDAQCGCPNRNQLLSDMESMTATERCDSKLIVILVDYLRDLVVSFGGELQRQLLRSLYQKLTEVLPNARIVRFHEAGFAVLLSDLEPCDETYFQNLFNEPLQIDNGRHMVSATVSVLRLRDFEDLEVAQMLSLAEASVSDARRSGRRFRLLDRGLHQTIATSYSLLSDLRYALRERQLRIVLQPKVRLDDQSLVGMEALVRWQHPDGHMIPPDRFIGLAEAAGLIDQLDHQVLEMTCEAIHEMNAAGIDVPVSFNASSSELTRTGYFDRLLKVIDDAGLSPPQLDLEVTESRAVQQFEHITKHLRRLIDLGMGVSIDDFGTGYSSLSYISQLTATTLKIDRMFVDKMDRSPQDSQLIASIIQLGRQLGFGLVAEGVETEEQRRMLMDYGCEIGQGYLFAKPMPPDELIRWATGKAAG